ncbi:MAG TPA: glycerol-3-phosphate dehydrogenase/oxidase [Gemmatimonadaceae bacterium]|nr:glycerol-3-phosphate dehydrogenase/oxidase [Gemmatimonadaceae bacterium]
MPDRNRALAELANRTFDVLIIGGGITGAGIARDAALRGLTVALIDKGDFASGTSSRSSRLVHGGVRYLEHGHLHLVFEASAERRRLLRLAPHLVQPLAFTWPVYAGQRLSRWKLSAGLTLYDVLALFRNVERHQRLSSAQVLEHEPRLARRALRGGVRYFDAHTDDARLTLANVLDAQALGAVAVNHAVFTGAARASTQHVAHVQDALAGERLEVRASIVVNAVGPWTDTVRALEGAGARSSIHGSKGTHVAIRRERVGNNDAVTLLHPRDGRVMFALPAGAHTIIGTTDTFTRVSPDEVRPTETDVAYLLEAANVVFPDARLQRDDVVTAWAGIRPLMPSSGSAVQASREHAIERGDGIVTITGGKLTTYRVMAEQVVDAVEQSLGRRPTRSGTRHRPFPAGTPRHTGSDPIVPGLPYTGNDVTTAVMNELACTLGDVLIRRTHVAYETHDNGKAAARVIAPDVARLLGWSERQCDLELRRYDAEVARIFAIARDQDAVTSS